MVVYLTEYAGDIDFPREGSATLHEALSKIMDKGYGNLETVSEEDDVWTEWRTPDPEDDKIVVYRCDTETGECKPIWGFWGWHWPMPEDCVQGTLPGNPQPLYTLAVAE